MRSPRRRFGKVVLALLVLGFAAYALWRFVQALAAAGDEKKNWRKRLGSLGRGAIYAALAFSAVEDPARRRRRHLAEREGAPDDGRRALLAGRHLARRPRAAQS